MTPDDFTDIHLTRQQRIILGLLLKHRGRVVTHDQIIDAFYWDRRDVTGDEVGMRVQLWRLRKALGDRLTIRTVWGEGHTIDKAPA